METIFIVLGVLITGYTGIITWLSLGLITGKKPKKISVKQDPTPALSLIVACRNEAQTIGNLLGRLQGQLQQDDEIILIDDHSEDDTIARIREFSSLKIHLLRLQDQEIPVYGKKQAIALGLSRAKNDLILFTDADCLPGPDWIQSMRNCLNTSVSPIQMILAPVVPESSGSVLHNLELLEFSLLMSVTECSATLGNPVLSNASNVLIRRKAFDAGGGYSGNLHYASGDDMFLLEKIKKHYGNAAIRFNTDRESIVRTRPVGGVHQWIMQRLRWASKAKGYRDPSILITSVIIYGYHAALLITCFFFLWSGGHSVWFPALFLIKIVVDFPLVAHGIRRYGHPGLWWLYIPAQLGGMVYVSTTGLFGQFLRPRWKGRKSGG